jgi:hypothetical protein
VFKVNVEKNNLEKSYKPFVDDGLKFNPYVNEGSAYNAFRSYSKEDNEVNEDLPASLFGMGWELVKRLFGWFGGSNEEVGEYYGKTVIDREEVHLADSDYIGEVLRRNGGEPRKVNLGAYVPRTDEIFVSPDSHKYGYPLKEIVSHEKKHRYDPRASEWEADQYALKSLRVDG